MSDTHKSEKSEKPVHKLHKKNNKIQIAVVLVALLLVGVIALLQINSNSDDKKSSGAANNTTSKAQGDAKLYIKPSTQEVTAGNSITLEVWVDTGNQPVNAVQANLTYPADKFDFHSIDSKGSAFEIQAMSTGGNGKINIARGHVGDVKGVSLVAKVILTAKTNKGDAKVQFAEGSAVVRSSDHLDILKDKTGGTFKVSKILSPVASIQINKAG